MLSLLPSARFMFLFAIIPFLMFGVNSSYGDTLLPPLAQVNHGISAKEVECREDLVLTVRDSGKPACLSPSNFLRSIDRGWGTFDIDYMTNHTDQLDRIISVIMQNRDLREQVIQRISDNPQIIEKIKSNEKLMNMLEGKGLIGQGEPGAQMGGMMDSLMGGGGFMSSKSGDSPLGGIIGDLVENMLPKMMEGMESSPSMIAQIRDATDLLEELTDK